MALPDLFSRRRREASGSVDVYQYDTVPPRLSAQIVHILVEAIGSYYGNEYSGVDTKVAWDYLRTTMCKELGLFQLDLSTLDREDAQKDYCNWLLHTKEVLEFLDGVELALRVVDTYVRRQKFVDHKVATARPDDAIAEANGRFRESGFGYRYENGELIRVDSEFIHSEAVVPALRLLSEGKYSAANSEFRSAHEAYRHDRYEDCLIGCAKAFESVLKVIAIDRRWPIKDTDTAKALLDAAFAANFLDEAVKQGFTSLRALLESAIPTPRNKAAGHGAGAAVRRVPARLASFQLHQTAAAILFLAETHKAG